MDDELDMLVWNGPRVVLPCDCKNCVHMEKMRGLAMKACNEAANRNLAVNEHVVFMWNEAVRLFPCERSDA